MAAAAGSAWDWHLVAPALRDSGHDPVAVDLPNENESAGRSEYIDTVARAIGDRFGAAVASGDFNQDGFADLAAGAWGERVLGAIDYLKTVDPSRRTIRFDLIQFYGGDDALREAANDHPEASPEQVRQWVPNGYYIRNVNPRLRTLPVPSDAPITVITLAWGNGHNSSEEHISVTLTKLATYMPTGLPFSITVRHGQVVKLAEIFVP